jgi:hypothetical protein
MLTQEKTTTSSLYETDYHLWVLETIKKLQVRDFSTLDLENLIEEVADLGRRDKRKLESLLIRLLEHLLKLKYWKSELSNNLGHWQAEVTNFRKQLKRELKSSPSLKPYLQEIFLTSYQDARDIASRRCQMPLEVFPEVSFMTLDQALDEDWFPESFDSI